MSSGSSCMPPPEPPLAQLQESVLEALLAQTPARAAALLVADGIAPEHRLAVYAGNVQANFEGALASSFPVTRRLVGAEYFQQAARAYQRQHPSRSGDLLPAGRQFPAFLGARHGADEFAYLTHVARFEWLCQEALLAAEHAPLDLAKLQRLAPSTYETLRFGLHPALRLFQAPYPVLMIWEAHQDESRRALGSRRWIAVHRKWRQLCTFVELRQGIVGRNTRTG